MKICQRIIRIILRKIMPPRGTTVSREDIPTRYSCCAAITAFIHCGVSEGKDYGWGRITGATVDVVHVPGWHLSRCRTRMSYILPMPCDQHSAIAN